MEAGRDSKGKRKEGDESIIKLWKDKDYGTMVDLGRERKGTKG